MKYIAPIGAADPNDPYVDGNPGTGTEGSAVPAAAIEHPMREIVSAITAAGLSPDENNLTQLIDAIEILSGHKRIGEPFALWDHLDGVVAPSNSGSKKYIKLTAGLTGDGEYNEGLLINESITGASPLIIATAEISIGPLAGENIYLLNTMEAFLRARGTSGEHQFDQMQRITGRFRSNVGTGGAVSASGALSDVVAAFPDGWAISQSTGGTRALDFNSANSPNARVSETTEGETRSKNISATFYMRIV